MRFYALAAAAALTATIAAPAFADETRVEARGGLFNGSGNTEATAGIAAGYDADMGPQAFIGGEVSADKLLAGGADIYVGLTGRGGFRLGEGKVFAAGGYTFAQGPNAWHLGAGYERQLSGNLYWKAEYRHFFADLDDADQIVAGVGLKF
jgi:opacity protein-like surface antigen